MAKLPPSSVDYALSLLDGWTREGDFIAKTFKFKTFLAGIRFVDKVARIAEAQEHHPDIHVRWTSVTLQIQTHEEGGITKWDLELAEEIEKALAKPAKKRKPAR
jgi:4a-hydroxytetrahydrobiopterin dehydratase